VSTNKIITILTDPPITVHDSFSEVIRRPARAIVGALRPPRLGHRPQYRGHPAVTRSLLDGLQSLGFPFNYNPVSSTLFFPHVHVLANPRTLRAVIPLKRAGAIGRLTAGPNVVVFANDDGSILADPAIDFVVTPSSWVSRNYLMDEPSLEGRIGEWAAGVSLDFWKFSNPKGKRNVLIYDKYDSTISSDRTTPFTDFLIREGLNVRTISPSSARGYTPLRYRQELEWADLMVGFSLGSESQGIAWLEAWASGVPTFVLASHTNVVRGRLFEASTAPYLSEQTGGYFQDLDSFKKVVREWKDGLVSFSPRKWVEVNQSDRASAMSFLELVT